MNAILKRSELKSNLSQPEPPAVSRKLSGANLTPKLTTANRAAKLMLLSLLASYGGA